MLNRVLKLPRKQELYTNNMEQGPEISPDQLVLFVDRLYEASDKAAHLIMGRMVEATHRDPVTGIVYRVRPNGELEDPRDFADGDNW